MARCKVRFTSTAGRRRARDLPVLTGYNDKFESLVGLAETDYHDILDMAGDLGEEMPQWTGTDREREALVQFLLTLKEKGDSYESAGL